MDFGTRACFPTTSSSSAVMELPAPTLQTLGRRAAKEPKPALLESRKRPLIVRPSPKTRKSPRWKSQGTAFQAQALRGLSTAVATEFRDQARSRAPRPRLARPLARAYRDEATAAPTIQPSLASKDGAPGAADLDCVGSGMAVECVVHDPDNGGAAATAAEAAPEGAVASRREGAREASLLEAPSANGSAAAALPEASSLVSSEADLQPLVDARQGHLDAGRGGEGEGEAASLLPALGSLLLLISPFFFWGSSMVAMKDVLPRAGPMFVTAFRLIPAGALLVTFGASKGRPMPSTPAAWGAILAFALVDAACFQGFLAEGLKRTSAGLGSVIIDSQPLTVAVLAAVLFGEHLGPRGVVGLLLGILGLCLLEVPGGILADSLSLFPSFFNDPEILGTLANGVASSSVTGGVPAVPTVADSDWSLVNSGEWWMLLAAQSMAVGTVMVRWVCRHADPIMATGWHLVLGGLPLLALSAWQHDPALQPGGLASLSALDWSLLAYTSVFGSAVSYGVFFYNASRGNLTKLSSLTFLTPAFAALFGYVFLGETLNAQQLFGALVTVGAIYLVNTQQPSKP